MGSSGSKKGAEPDRKTSGTTPIPVSLNIYEPKDSANRGLPAFQIFHSGVEVFGTEYVFGGGGAGLSTGVFSQRPKWMPDSAPWKYKETLSLGTTSLTKNEVQAVLREMKSDWKNNTYDLTARNCNHFSDAFAKRMGCTVKVPAWLNRAARVGNAIRSVIGKGGGAKDNKKNSANAAASTGVDDGKYSVITEGSILDLVDCSRAGCMNESASHPLSSILGNKPTQTPSSSFLESDADEQLLIVLPFKQTVKPRAVVLHAKIQESAPKTVKVFINMPNLEFQDAEDADPTVEFTMEGETATFKLPAAKCNCVSSMTIFVEDNHGADATVLHHLDIIGKK